MLHRVWKNYIIFQYQIISNKRSASKIYSTAYLSTIKFSNKYKFHDLPSSSTSYNAAQLVVIDPIEQTFVYAGRSIVRTNFPLSLSWACTIHKIQGASIDSCLMDLGSSVFEPGMAYVALSRVTSLQGLFLLKLNPDVTVANQLVLEEYEQLRQKAKRIS